MIIIKLDKECSIKEQFDKIVEEVKELEDELNLEVDSDKLYSQLDNIVEEAFDVVQATNQLLFNILGDNYMIYYKKHLNKLQNRAKNNRIKIDQYYDF